MLTLSGAKFAIPRPSAPDLTAVRNAGLGLAIVLGTGALIAAALPPGASPWLIASSFLAPASVAFAAHWWISQRP